MTDRADMPPRVLVVDDHPSTSELIRSSLLSRGMDVSIAGDGHGAVAAARTRKPDIVILDLVLPDLDGIEVLRQIRTFSDAYVMVVSCRDDEGSVLVALTAGADDYMTKPFFPAVLAARTAAMLRRPRDLVGPAERRIGDLVVQRAAREVSADGKRIDLTRREYDILEALLDERGGVLTRDQLMDRIAGSEHGGSHPRAVTVHMANLRQKIESDPQRPKYLLTVRGVGYRLAAASTSGISARTRHDGRGHRISRRKLSSPTPT